MLNLRADMRKKKSIFSLIESLMTILSFVFFFFGLPKTESNEIHEKKKNKHTERRWRVPNVKFKIIYLMKHFNADNSDEDLPWAIKLWREKK